MPDFSRETILWQRGARYVAGVDEAGRGCLAGPVVAAAVVLPSGSEVPGVDDSKRLSPAMREQLYPRILSQALAVGVGVSHTDEIDRLNILWASMEAMRRAVLDLAVIVDQVLVDGNRTIPDAHWPQEAVIGGDAVSASIAAASIIAKVTRDRMMVEYGQNFPDYGFAEHKGYATKAHFSALEMLGPCGLHRRSFRLSRTAG